MKSVPKRRAIDHVNPDLNPERVGRMWSAVEAAQHKPARRTRYWLAAAAVILLGTGSFVALRTPELAARLAAPGERIVADARPTDLSLPDGTSVALSRESTLSVVEASAAGATRLRVDRGSARFDVPHQAGRNFVVEARDVRVVVRGTRFVVQVLENVETQIQVSVERGRVEVQDKKGHVLSTLSPNQSWSMVVGPAPLSAPEAEPALEPIGTPASNETNGSAGPPPAPVPSVAPSSHAVPPFPQGASELLERANRARIAGQAADAAAAYERVFTRFPRDPRAGLAAFELARIRLDSLKDARGALLALRFALGHNQGGFAAEDAAALRIDALQRLGDLSACRKARTSFLSTYPHSAHEKRVLAACPE